MSYTSARAKYRPVSGSTQETTTTTTSTKLQQPTKYSEQIVRYGRKGQEGAQEIVTRKYQVPTKVTETKTRYDATTGTTQKTTTIGYKPEEKVVREVRRYGTPTNAQKTTTKIQPPAKVVNEVRRYGTPFSDQKTTSTVSKFPPSAKVVTEVRRRFGTPTNAQQTTTTTTTTSTKFQQPTKYSEQIVRYGRKGQEGAQEIVTRKYQVPTKVTETKTRYEPKTGTTQKTTTIGYKPEEKVVREVRRYGTPTNAQKATTTTTTTTSRTQASTKAPAKKTRYDGLSCSKGESFGTEGLQAPEPKTRFGAPLRARGKGNDGFVVTEKRSEKYSNENGKEKKEVTVEKTTADGTKRREVRRFYGSK
jgi:hypothetical protein